jgi:hypothetical protein
MTLFEHSDRKDSPGLSERFAFAKVGEFLTD